IFHNAHLPYKLSRANRAEKDGVAIEFPEYVDGTAEEAKNTVSWISFSEEDLPLGEVRASHLGANYHALLRRFVAQTRVTPTSRTAARFAERDVMECGAVDPKENHSGLMPANLTTLAHFSVSAATKLPKSEGEPAITVPPRSANRALSW